MTLAKKKISPKAGNRLPCIIRYYAPWTIKNLQYRTHAVEPCQAVCSCILPAISEPVLMSALFLSLGILVLYLCRYVFVNIRNIPALPSVAIRFLTQEHFLPYIVLLRLEGAGWVGIHFATFIARMMRKIYTRLLFWEI
jgi:hypothetical protein